MGFASDRGFTLIELMVSLVLGLLISAAALQILYTNRVSSNVQKAGAKVIETSTFGQNFFTKQLRRASYGSTNFKLKYNTPQGGVVLTAPQDLANFDESNLRGLSKSNQRIPLDLLTVAASPRSASNTTVANSDQLTIQYQMPFDGYRDCQGRGVRKGDYVIERYFVRTDANNQLGLACASAIYTYDETMVNKATSPNKHEIDIDKYTKPEDPAGTSSGISNLAGNGEIIIPNVDYFRVLLGVSDRNDFATNPNPVDSSNNSLPILEYIPIPAHNELANVLGNKRIVNLQVGIVMRSNDSVTAAKNPKFQVLDKSDIQLNAPYSQDGKMRRVMTSTILLRNARGTVDAP